LASDLLPAALPILCYKRCNGDMLLVLLIVLLPMQYTAISHKQLDEASSDDGFTALSSYPTFRFDGRIDTCRRKTTDKRSEGGFKSILCAKD